MTPKPEQRITDFENMGFGMFVHWGLYSQLGMGEWTYEVHKRNMSDYKKLIDTFTACEFDARKLVMIAKNAGCKYIVLTTRHHEGFSLYDTHGLSGFDVMHSPAGRDIVAEFVNACNEHQIAPFFYHTTLDWYNPDFENDFKGYLEYLRKSIELLCTNYGKIGGFWFDGNWSKKDVDWKESELYGTIRKHQPEAIIINNTGLGAQGALGHREIDSVTFEQGRPAPMNREGMKKYIAVETCYTMNDHWGIGANDFNYKSPAQLIEALCNCRKIGANLLLNIGPNGNGGIDPFQKALMEIMGRWTDIYGEAIYTAKPHPAVCENSKNFVLCSDEFLYFFIFDLKGSGSKYVVVDGRPSGAFAFKGIDRKIEWIEWMDNSERLEFIQTQDSFGFNATNFPYGTSTCVRVAKAKIK